MGDQSFRQNLDQLRENWKNATSDGSLQASDYVQLAADVCGTVESLLRGIGPDDAAFNQLAIDCEEYVQEYIVPLDLGKYKVPAVLERFVIDPQLPLMVRPLLEAIRQKQQATPPA